jgi:hypothetical protein
VKTHTCRSLEAAEVVISASGQEMTTHAVVV